MALKIEKETTSNTIKNIGSKSIAEVNRSAKIFRVQVKGDPIYAKDGKVLIRFIHSDNPNINNLTTENSSTFNTHAVILDGVPIPPTDSYGLVGSIFGNPIGDDLYYLGTILNSQQDKKIKTPKNSFSHVTEKSGIIVNGSKGSTTITGGQNKIKVTDDLIKLGTDGAGLSITGKDISFKNAKGEENFIIGDDITITSKGNIRFVSLEGSIEMIGEKVINKTVEELVEKEPIENESNKENITDFVTGSIEIGASQYKISITDSLLVSLNPFSGTSYEVEIMGGDSQFKLANGDFLVSLLNGGFTEKKFQVTIGKLNIIKTAQMKLDSKGFKIESGTPGLFFNKYTLNLNDSGFGPLSSKNVEVGYKGIFGMKLGISAEEPLIGRSNIDVIGDQVYLGKPLPGVGKALMGRVVTTYTDPVVDYITGIMHIGSFSVFATS